MNMNLANKARTGNLTLTEFDGHIALDSDTSRQADDYCVLFLDVETTGFSPENDAIIQLALRPIFVNRKTFKISHLTATKVLYNDPGTEISEEISRLTGVTQADVTGETVDWNWILSVINKVDFVVCHNAKFDRAFIMKHLREADILEPSTVWACSLRQVNWKDKCKASSAQEVLCVWHGFYYQAHDAANDVNALIHLLSISDKMEELLTAAQASHWRVFAVNLPFDKKDEIKSRQYRWDGEVRMWSLTLKTKEAADNESSHLITQYNIEPQIFEITPQYLFA
jgi:DNA polymerase-3 subunit epsilon